MAIKTGFTFFLFLHKVIIKVTILPTIPLPNSAAHMGALTHADFSTLLNHDVNTHIFGNMFAQHIQCGYLRDLFD